MAKFLFSRRKYILVIEIGKIALKVASFLRSASSLELLDYSLEKINPENDSSIQISDYLHAFLKKGVLPVKEAILSIADTDSVAIKYCQLPALKHNEILSAAIWQLKDQVHFDLESAYFDWRVIKEFSDEEGARQQGIIFAFCRREAVEKYLACLRQCGLHTSAILASALNYGEVLKSLAKDKTVSSEIVLDLEYLNSVLSLYIDKKLHFTRYLPVSVDTYTRSLIGTLASERGKVALTLSEAEEIRDNIGIPQDASAFVKDNLQASQIISLIRPVLESIVRETKHSLNYFTSTLNAPLPQIIYTTGLGANLKNLDAYLAKELGFPVERLPFPEILSTTRISQAKVEKDRSQLVSCVGAVLLAGRNVSLLAGGVRMRWVTNALTKRLLSFFAVIGGVVLFLMLISILSIPVYSYRLKKAKSFFSDKKQLASFFEKAQTGGNLVFEVSRQRLSLDAFLNFISESIPAGLRLNELELNQYHGELTLQGEARRSQDLEAFLKKLEASDYFLSLKPVTMQSRDFKIKCKLQY